MQDVAAGFQAHAAVGRPRYVRGIELAVPVARTSAAERGTVEYNIPAGPVRRPGDVQVAAILLVAVTGSVGQPRVQRQNTGKLPVTRQRVDEPTASRDPRDGPNGVGNEVIRLIISRNIIELLVRRVVGNVRDRAGGGRDTSRSSMLTDSGGKYS